MDKISTIETKAQIGLYKMSMSRNTDYIFTVKITENTNQIAERLGVNIAGKEIIRDRQIVSTKLWRCYVIYTDFTGREVKRGPIYLEENDIQTDERIKS